MYKLPPYEAVAGNLSKRARVAQSFMPAAFINDSRKQMDTLETLIRTHQVGGLCFFHSRASAAANFEGNQKVSYHPDSLKRLKDLIHRYQEASAFPLLIAMDAEWGLAMRVEEAPAYPYAVTLGALKAASESLVYEVGLSMARDCRDAGIHWNFAPVVDVNTNPGNPVIGYRAFGSRPDAVLRKARALMRGLDDGGVLSCLKHFPGHGDTGVDSHLDLPVLDKDLPALAGTELTPFRELVREGAPAVMMGHLAVPALDASGLPASLSKPAIDLLRASMGFRGVVVTDAMNMHALHHIDRNPVHLNLKAYQAGNDLLCYPSRAAESIDVIVSRTGEDRLETTFRRIWKLKERVFDPSVPPRLPAWSPEGLNRELAPRCLAEIRKPGHSLQAFRTPDLSIVYFGKRPDPFLHRIRAVCPGREMSWSEGSGVPGTGKVVFALTPPSMKPADNFGLPDSFFETLNRFLNGKQVLLYLFGNPYLLQKLPVSRFEGVVCAFQPLPAFQEAAAGHFLGTTRAEGELSLDLVYG